MTQKRVQRRLAAILAADVVGYSRLMEADEAGTHARLKSLREEFLNPKVAEYGGRIVKTTGDGTLIEFGSAVDAVSHAIDVQRDLAERNADEPEDARITLRLGINVGDIIIDGDDIHGDGVNVAARLEGLAEPGGIYVSGAVHDQVVGKLAANFDDLGEHSVKNIARPIRVFRVTPETDESTRARDGITPAASGGGGAPRPDAGPTLPDIPSIAVLPFANMSGDAEQEFFADGITEDILTELSRFRDLFVISRTSAFKYKGQSLNVPEVAAELGVQYVVEGSVRKAGNRVRVTVQLIDAEADRHVWAERYDRDLEDIFAIQDEITQTIVATLPGRVEAARRERAARKPTDSMAAYELVIASKVLHHRSDPESNRQARDMIERATALDPKYAHAHAWRACIVGQAWTYGWVPDTEEVWDEVTTEVQAALALDETDSDVHRILAAIHLTRHEFDKAMMHEDRALALNPNDDLIVVQKGEILTWIGEPEGGIPWIEKAMRLNPYHPERFWGHLGRAHFGARRYAEAIAAFEKMNTPNLAVHAFMAAAHAANGDADGARARAAEVLAGAPDFSAGAHIESMHYAKGADRAHLRDALIAAGLPS